MADSKIIPSTTDGDTLSNSTNSIPTPEPNHGSSSQGITFAERGAQVGDNVAAEGFDAERMRDRSLLTAEEEKKLLRRVDLRLMTICSLLFLMKNLDADNISNARIMNRGTDMNIMTELGMSSDQYNLLNVLYYVSHHILPVW